MDRRVRTARDEVLPRGRRRIMREGSACVADAVEVRHEVVRHVRPDVEAPRAGRQGSVVDLVPRGDFRSEIRLHRAAAVGGDRVHAHLRVLERVRVAVRRPHRERIARRLHGGDVIRRVRGRVEDVHARGVARLNARDEVGARVGAAAQEKPRLVVGQRLAHGADEIRVERDEQHAVLRGERLRLDGGHDAGDEAIRPVALQLHHALRRLVRREERKIVLELRQRLAFPLGPDPTAKRAHAHVLEVVP